MSSRPTGYRRTSPGTSEVTVGRPWGSRAVETTPSGLLTAYTTRGWSDRTWTPSTVTSVSGLTSRAGSVMTVPSTSTRPLRTISSAARREATPADARYFPRRMCPQDMSSPPGAAYPSARGPSAARDDAWRAHPAPLPPRPGVAVGGPRRAVIRGDDGSADRAADRARGAGAVFVPVAPARAHCPRRHDQGIAPDHRRAAGRSGADGLPRRPALALPLVPVGLSSDMHVLRNRADALRPKPDRLRDPGAGASLPAPRRSRPRGVHGHGRADDEPRRGPGRLRAAARPRDRAPAHRDLDRRVGPRNRAVDARTDADPPRAVPACARRRPALAADAGQRALPAVRRARRLRGSLRAQAAQGVRRVRDARRRQRLGRAGAGARRAARPEDLQGEPDPLQPDGLAVRGLEPEGDRRLPPSAGGPGSVRDRQADPRTGDRRGVRTAGGALACRGSPAAELAQDPLDARARVARSQQPLSQLLLDLWRQIELPHIRQLVDRAQAEQPQEQLAGAVQHRPELGAAAFLDHPALEQRRGCGLGVDAADPRDLRARDRLQVGNDRERLRLSGVERRRPRLGEQPPRRGLGIGMGAEREAARQLADDEPPPLELVVLAQPLERAHHLVQLRAGRVGQRVRANRLGAQEQERLDRRLEPRAHALTRCAAAPAAALGSIMISPNGSACSQTSSPCL